MKRSIFKSILAGIFIGGAMFIMPFFILKVILFFMIAGLFFRAFVARTFGRRAHMHRLAFIDRMRGMSEDEYNQFKTQAGRGCGPFCHDYQNNAAKHETQE